MTTWKKELFCIVGRNPILSLTDQRQQLAGGAAQSNEPRNKK